MKRITILLLLFLASSVCAADWCATFSGYRDAVRDKHNILRTNTTWVTDTVLNQLIREAVIDVVNDVRAIKKVYNDTTEYRQFTYSIDSGILGIISVRWVSPNRDSIKSLLYVPQDRWNELVTTSTSGEDGYLATPSYYDYIDGSLFIYPPPETHGDTLQIVAWRKVPSIAASDSLVIIPQKFRVAIVNYVAYQIAKAKSHPFMTNFYADFISAMTKARADGGIVSRETTK